MSLLAILMSAAGGDSDPDPFTFTATTGVNPSTLTTSGAATVSGITGAVPVSVTGGEVSVNGGAYAPTGLVLNGQSITLRATSSAAFTTQAQVDVTVGGYSTTWNITTRAADTVPAAFSFTDTTGVEPSTATTSGTITISGLEPNYTVTVSAAGGTVDAGTSSLSGSFAASKDVLTSGTGTIAVAARVTSSVNFSAAANVIITCGGVSDTYTATTRAADTTPAAFAFTDASGANPGALTTSNTVTITGLEPNYAMTVTSTGGTVDAGTSVLSGSFAASKNVTTSGTGTLVVAAQIAANATFGGTADCVVTVGTLSDTFTVTTRAADTTPGAFSFTAASGVNPGTVNTSNTVTVSGLEPNFSVTVTVSGGTVDAGTSALSGTFAASKVVTTSGTGTIVVAARGTASASFSTQVDVTVTIGGVNGIYSITTRAVDADPNAYSFTAASGVNPSTVNTSNTVTISGLEPNVAVSVSASGGTISAGTSTISGSYTSSTVVTASGTGTIVVSARGTASASYSTTVTVFVYVGNGSSTYQITTRAADTTPNAFAFTDVTGAALSTVYTSTTITLSGMDPSRSITITCTGGTIDAGTSALSGTFATSKAVTTSGTGTVVLAARVTSSASNNTAVNCVVTCSGVSDTYTVTTLAPDTTPDQFTFTDQTNVIVGTVVQSAQITITGMSPGISVTITSSGSTGNGVDAGTTAVSGTYATSKTVTTSGTGTIVARARVTASGVNSTTTNCLVSLGGVSDTFSITTSPLA